MLKKCFLLLSLFSLLIASVSAKTLDENRWQWFYSDSVVTGRVDQGTYQYDATKDSADVWVAWTRPYTGTGSVELDHYTINFKENQIQSYDYTVYPLNSEVPSAEGNNHGITTVVVPNSSNEAMVKKVADLVKRDDKLKEQADKDAALKAEQAKEAKAEAEAEKKEAHRRNNQNVLNTLLGIGSIFI